MSKDFESQFDDFAASHADVFLPAVDMEPGTEHQLEFMECFHEYLEHFEGKIKRFIGRWEGERLTYYISILLITVHPPFRSSPRVRRFQ